MTALDAVVFPLLSTGTLTFSYSKNTDHAFVCYNALPEDMMLGEASALAVPQAPVSPHEEQHASVTQGLARLSLQPPTASSPHTGSIKLADERHSTLLPSEQSSYCSLPLAANLLPPPLDPLSLP